MAFPTDDINFVGSHQPFRDMGATNHASFNPFMMSSIAHCDGLDTLRVGNGTGLLVVSVGLASVATRSRNFVLSNVLHDSGLSASLLSIQKFARDNSVFFEFHPNCFFVKDLSTKVVLFRGCVLGGLYSWPVLGSSPVARVFSSLWHNRFNLDIPMLVFCFKFYIRVLLIPLVLVRLFVLLIK